MKDMASRKIHLVGLQNVLICVLIAPSLAGLEFQDKRIIIVKRDTNHSSSPNEAADKLCLAPSVIEMSRTLVERNVREGKDSLTSKEFRRLVRKFNENLAVFGGSQIVKSCEDKTNGETVQEISGVTHNCADILKECSSLDSIYTRHASASGLNRTQLVGALVEAAYTVTNPKCQVKDHTGHGKGYKPTKGQAWGFGLGFVIAVVMVSNVGAFMLPCMSKTFFQRILQFLVAMGAGTLVATGLLVLIPEAFDLVSIEEIGDDYIWKGSVILLSIYFFCVSERFIKLLLKSRETTDDKKNHASIHVESPGSMEVEMMKKDLADKEKRLLSDKELAVPASNGKAEEELDHGHSHFVLPPSGGGGKRRGGRVATVAWMVMIGDVIHNFVDGMAIGAAFTENIYLGVSIGIAVLCEELPHELGDVAILLHSGLSMKRAIFINFLSACVCFLGLIVGILLGESTDANRWILSVAGGLFLYVPLVDMLPDMGSYLDVRMAATTTPERAVSREVWLLLLCQSSGLLLGICIILVVVNFSGDIMV